MSVNFKKADCQTTISETKFGIVDVEDGTPAKIELTEEGSWNAIVLNDNSKQILFTAIDHCVEILRQNGEMDSRCDVMLTYEDNLLLIELKNKRDSWQADGLSQIESTIKRLIEDNEEHYFSFKKRRVIVANAKHQFPCFQELHLEMREYFMRTYRARIQFEAEIMIR